MSHRRALARDESYGRDRRHREDEEGHKQPPGIPPGQDGANRSGTKDPSTNTSGGWTAHCNLPFSFPRA